MDITVRVRTSAYRTIDTIATVYNAIARWHSERGGRNEIITDRPLEFSLFVTDSHDNTRQQAPFKENDCIILLTEQMMVSAVFANEVHACNGARLEETVIKILDKMFSEETAGN